jgi:hypothetical protein
MDRNNENNIFIDTTIEDKFINILTKIHIDESQTAD